MESTLLPNSEESRVHLRVLATSDLHAHLLSYDYFTDQPRDLPSLSRLATLINEQRQTARNSVLVDNGDFLQGTALSDHHYRVATQKISPVIRAMNHLHYDAAALGNHEFDFGLDAMNKAIDDANFPILCENLISTPTNSPKKIHFKPHIILNRLIHDTDGQSHVLKIGLFGILPPQTTKWEHNKIGDSLHAIDAVEAARQATRALKKEGADIIIALSHSGIDPNPLHPFKENVSAYVAAIDGVDAIVCGHTHLVFPNDTPSEFAEIDPQRGTLYGKPAVMCGHAGSYLGQLDLDLVQTDLGWHVASHSSTVHPVLKRTPSGALAWIAPEDPCVRDLLAKEHADTLKFIRRPVGFIRHAIHSHFSLVQDDCATRLVGTVQREFVRARLADSPLADLPILSATAPLKCGGRSGPSNYTNIAQGEIATRHVADLYPFPNEVSALRLSGAQIIDWLEMSASIFNHIQPGQHNQMLRNPNFPSYNFDTIHGLTYQIDLSNPARYSPEGHIALGNAHRIKNVQLNGVPIQEDQDFVLATNNYRAMGGGNYPHTGPQNLILTTQHPIRDLLTEYLSNDPETCPNLPQTWAFKEMANTSVFLDTGPDAKEHAQTVKTLNLQEIGPQSNGFWRYRVHLDTVTTPTLASNSKPDYISA